MKSDFNHIQSIYWVFTQLCNDNCDHCYNDSSPFGKRISEADCMAIIDNLPDKIDRLILSGGEPVAEKKLLYAILDRIQEKYNGATQIMLQTNGDLLNEKILKILIEKGVTRFDIASIDRYHKKAGSRLMELAELFESCGVIGTEKDPLIEGGHYLAQNPLSWGYWGASEDMWLGGNWARGKALQNDIWKKDPEHNFCTILSGARNFLGGYDDIPQEISIQLWRINPCCPGTHFPMGDARKQKVADVLSRASKNAVFKMLNEGKPLEMGLSLGISKEEATQKNKELKNICLYCDHFLKCNKNEIFDKNGVKETKLEEQL
ncbi:radical SAM protein [Aquimarina algicola]|uniref:Radical SAM protein n=1 Tax=Aquimarina algicola TaxID=2589995 RepID=A0A504J9E8_9FLAO|nr:radical SAM protein [Aquimarina algicola]TPN87244.1 radical SAM protein [Aquimarina algicola]